jgi:hypothetical protein
LKQTVPVQWQQNDLTVCLRCGEIVEHVPENALKELRRDGAGS